MSATNRGTRKNTLDYYATPEWVTRLILPKLDWHAVESVLDPCAGDGAILRAVLDGARRINELRGIEIDPDRAAAAGAECRDAMTTPWGRPDLVIMNPPFNLAQSFCERAFSEISPGGEVAALMRLAMLESRSRAGFWAAHPADVYVLGKRPSFTGGGSDSAAYGWFVWGPGRGNRWWRLDP